MNWLDYAILGVLSGAAAFSLFAIVILTWYTVVDYMRWRRNRA